MAVPIARDIVCDSPAAFAETITTTAGIPVGIDASPIYTTLNASVTIDGSYYGTVGTSYEDIEYIYNAVAINAVQLDRIGLRDIFYGIVAANFEVLLNYDVSTYIDVMDTDSVPAGEFIAICSPLPSVSGTGVMPFSPPKFSPSLNHASGDGQGVGTRKDHNDSPASESDLDVTVVWSGPLFRGTIEEGDLEMFFTLTGTINTNQQPEAIYEEIVIDCSSWDSTDFRDIRGTYTEIDTDANGITYDWEIVIA